LCQILEIWGIMTRLVCYLSNNHYSFLTTKAIFMKATGIVLLILGIGLTFFTAFRYFTREKVVDIGKLEITRDKPHTISWSPLIGIALIGIGGVVFWQASRKDAI
jgi:hypothetical protein